MIGYGAVSGMWERWLKGLVLTYLLGLFCGNFIWIGLLKSGLLDTAFIGILPLILFQEYQYYAAAGAIGGSLYSLRLFYWHNIRSQLNIYKWWIWYLLRPLMSAGTALMIVILFKSGILLVSANNSVLATIGMSFLVGYGFGKVMDKLDGLTETLFNGQPNPTNRPQEPLMKPANQETQNPDHPLQQMSQDGEPHGQSPDSARR
jgi:hypothetical protein